ncbi:MAG: iron dependent repressor, metal binding and dimerization domain protein, partial [bacterium]
LNYIPYENIELTKKGKKLGKFLVERNKLLQKFLEVIGSNCDKEEEAEAIEHYLSNETVYAMTSVVDFFNDHPESQKKLKKYQSKYKTFELDTD